MKVIIAGSRTINDIKLVEQAVEASGFDITEEVCGCSYGVDNLGQIWANRRTIPCMTMPANWNSEGKAAGPKRNARMAAYADALILVWDGQSKGSASMLAEMQKLGKPIYQLVVKENSNG